jgi:hypothetical protein
VGRDNSPRERQRNELQRKLNRRASYDRILIVTEGAKTEPQYLKEIRSAYRLHTANVEVQHSELGTSPLQVVQYARDLFQAGNPHRRIPSRGFDRIYAVFDRDEHQNYYEALQLAEQLDLRLRNDLKQRVPFKAIASVPCFELWLLLHFRDVLAPIHRNEVIQQLTQYLPGYAKGMQGAFARTMPNLGIAVERASVLATNTTAQDDPEPFTSLHELVLLLTQLRNQ